MKIRVTRCLPSREEDLLRIYSGVFPEKKITLEKIRQIFLREPSTVLLALCDQDAVNGKGVSAVAGFLYWWTVADELQILEIGVDEHYRRQGVARMLLGRIEFEARKKNMKITLEVRSRNHPAIKLYENTGFVAVGLRECYYEDGEDALLYEWKKKE